jgi:hypothetical protein
MDQNVEEVLNQWFSIIIGQCVRVGGPVLKRKTEELAKKLGRNNFKATASCLDGNADEIGLFYHAKPDDTLSYKHATLSGSGKALDCVTVLSCSNMSGTNKQKRLVTGKKLSLGALRALVWTVCQFCTILTKMGG